MSEEYVAVHEEVSLDKFEYDDELDGYLYPCPCGDEFFISVDDLKKGASIADCDSCSLKVKVIYDYNKFMKQFNKTNNDNKTDVKQDNNTSKEILVN